MLHREAHSLLLVLRYRGKTLPSYSGLLFTLCLYSLAFGLTYDLCRDPRNPVAPLRRHSTAHSDDVTSVRFAPNSSSNGQAKLLSGSTDGLICISDANQEDEDEAVEYTGNWGCSVARAGWLHGSGSPRVWARSDMETVSLWSSEVHFNLSMGFILSTVLIIFQLDLLQNADRERLAHVHAALPWVTDYIVECHSSRRRGGAMHVFVGSSE